MPRRQHHPRRRLRKAAHALGLGTTLAIMRSSSAAAAAASWHQAPAVQQQRHCPAFLVGAQIGSRGKNCNYDDNRGHGSVLSRTSPVVSRALTMSNSDRSQGKQGFFGGWNASQRCPPAGGSGSTSRVGPLKATSLLLHDEPTFFGGRQPFTGHVARWFVKRTIRSHALWIAALYVEVEARSNMEAMIGRFDTVSVEFQQVKFKRIQVTGGARFELLGVDLLTLAFLPGPLKPSPRFNLPCEVTGTATFTNTDLNLSPAIRCFAQMVVNNVLEPLRTKASAAWIGWPAQAKTPSRVGSGVGEGEQGQEQEGDQKKRESPVNVTTVRVHGSKLAVEGEVTNTEPLLRMRFRCEFSLSTSHDGHVIQIRDPSVFWGMSSGRVPLPVRPYTIDLGDRARIENLSISKGTLCVGVRFILSPVEHLNVSPPDVHRGDIQHDLAETLSTLICGILRFKRD